MLPGIFVYAYNYSYHWGNRGPLRKTIQVKNQINLVKHIQFISQTTETLTHTHLVVLFVRSNVNFFEKGKSEEFNQLL